MPSDLQARAAQELLARRKAREGLLGFVEYTHPQWSTADHHRLIAEKLEKVERGECRRLMIFMPPRHGKSELSSRRFPAWYLGRHPDRQIITASYNADLAGDFGREVRNILMSPEFGNVFPGIRLAADSQAANRWHTNEGGSYVSAGVGTAITGRGAHVLLIDDPIKDRTDADSEMIRDSLWAWYRSTAYTRLMPGGAVVVIETRWHEDDLAGRLLNEEEEWEVLELPALAGPDDPMGRAEGEALWPEWYDVGELERIKRTVGPYEWSALFQQRPVSEEGAYFQREWVKHYEELPSNLTYWGASDYAVTADGGDYTVHGVIGVTKDDDIYVVDWWRDRKESATWVEKLIDLMEQYKPVKWGEEGGQIIKSLGPFIAERMKERRVYCVREQFTSSRDKGTRARSIQGRMSMGKVLFPKHKPWTGELVSELLKFPQGKHDDQVDVLSLFGRMLESFYGRGPSMAPRVASDGQRILDSLTEEKRVGRYG